MSNNFKQSKKNFLGIKKYTNFKVFPLIQLISRTNSVIDNLFIFYISNMFFIPTCIFLLVYLIQHLSSIFTLYLLKFLFSFFYGLPLVFLIY